MKTIRVWDPLVRVLHWTLVICVLANLLNESGEAIHRWLGYTASAVVVVRVFWGFVGPHYARFADWFPTRSRLAPYVKALLHNRAPRHVGHNPAGAVMMLALMALVLLLGVTGYMMGTDTFFGEDWVEGLHEALANILIGAVVLHVGAALFESWKHQENLIASMLHGRKAPLALAESHDETAAR
ncbi:MAG: cytochrome b/b6 domain-containing protein [Propionivibrio sp.]